MYINEVKRDKETLKKISEFQSSIENLVSVADSPEWRLSRAPQHVSEVTSTLSVLNKPAGALRSPSRSGKQAQPCTEAASRRGAGAGGGMVPTPPALPGLTEDRSCGSWGTLRRLARPELRCPQDGQWGRLGCSVSQQPSASPLPLPSLVRAEASQDLSPAWFIRSSALGHRASHCGLPGGGAGWSQKANSCFSASLRQGLRSAGCVGFPHPDTADLGSRAALCCGVCARALQGLSTPVCAPHPRGSQTSPSIA